MHSQTFHERGRTFWRNYRITTAVFFHIFGFADDIPPEITCPDSIVKETDSGLSSAEVTWDMPSVSDNLDGTDALTVSVRPSGLKSPHRFEIGSFYIEYVATDTAGLSNDCVFKVVVQGKIRREGESDFNQSNRA